MKSRFKIPSPAMVVACVALLVALGGTSYAAVAIPDNSVGSDQLKANAVTSAKIKNHTIASSDLKSGTVKSLKGDKGATGATGASGATGATGPQGPQGPQGVPGAAGSAVAYGDVDAAVSNGGVTVHHGWTGAIEHQGVGIYCMSGFTGTLSNVVASVDASSPDLGATAQARIGTDQCTAPGTQVEVQTYVGTTRTNEPFDFVVN